MLLFNIKKRKKRESDLQPYKKYEQKLNIFFCRGRHCVASEQPSTVKLFFFFLGRQWGSTLKYSNTVLLKNCILLYWLWSVYKTPLHLDHQLKKNNNCWMSHSQQSETKDDSRCYADRDGSQLNHLISIVATMLSLWSMRQTGYCLVHSIKKGNAMALWIGSDP